MPPRTRHGRNLDAINTLFENHGERRCKSPSFLATSTLLQDINMALAHRQSPAEKVQVHQDKESAFHLHPTIYRREFPDLANLIRWRN